MAAQTHRTLRFQVKLGRERGVYHIELAACIDDEVKRASVADHHWDHEKGSGHDSQSEDLDVTRTTRFSLTGNGRHDKCSRKKNTEGTS